MLNSKYAPMSKSEYSKVDLNANYTGNKFTASKNSTTTNDFLISDDNLVDGAVLTVLDAVSGDHVTFQVIDKDNVLGYGVNVVLGQYVTNWYMDPQSSKQMDLSSSYPAKIFGGLYLRTIYVSVGEDVDPTVIVNFKLQKILW
jgi:hypothetical protein